MEVISQDLKFSEYNHALYVKDRTINIIEKEMICLMITNKDTLTKNNIQFDDIETKKINEKTLISYKEFKIFYADGNSTSFIIYTNKELEKTLKNFKKFTQSIKPLIYDSFIGQSPLLFNSDNYCYIKKEQIKKTTLKNAHADLGDQHYINAQNSPLIIERDTEGSINFKVLELDIETTKLKLNIYLQKTLEYNQLHAPGLISIKQKIKKML